MTRQANRNPVLFAALVAGLVLSCGCAAKRVAPQIQRGEAEHIELEPQQFMDILVAALEAKAKIEATTEIPIELNDLVIQEIAFFLGPARKQLKLGFERMPDFQEEIVSILEDKTVPRELIYVAFVESRFNPEAVSPSGAKGMWQFTDETAKHLGLNIGKTNDQRKDVSASTEAAARYLKTLHGKFGDWYFALAAYNAGPGEVGRLIERYRLKSYWEMCSSDVPVKDETKRYVAQFIAAVLIFEAPEKFGVGK